MDTDRRKPTLEEIENMATEQANALVSRDVAKTFK